MIIKNPGTARKRINIIFFIIVLSYLGLSVDLLTQGTYRYLTMILQFLSGFLCILYFWNIKAPQSSIYIIFTFYTLFLAIRGYLLQNWISYYQFDLLTFSFSGFLLICQSKETKEYVVQNFPKLFVKLLYIGLPLSWFFILKLGLSPATTIDNRVNSFTPDLFKQYGDAYLIAINFAPLLLPFISSYEFSKMDLTVLILSNLTFLLTGIFTATRVSVLIPLLSLFLFYLSYKKQTKRKKFIKKKKLKFNYKILTLLIISLIIIIYIYGFEALSFAANLSFNRLFDTNDQNYFSYRMIEAAELLDGFSINELIFGRGIGGSHNYGIWINVFRGMNMTHFDFLQLILKGGVILLMFFYGLCIYSIYKILKYSDKYKQYAFIIILYLAYGISHTRFMDYFYLVPIYISISYALSLNSKKLKINRN